MERLGSTTLPPCRICAAASSGFHYGVYTCEACKAFFRRSYSKRIEYECPEKESCVISYENRNSCAYCRYQKCIKMGMCKEASKTGRYSHEKRAANIRELKKLQEQLEPEKTSCPMASPTTKCDSVLNSSEAEFDGESDANSICDRKSDNQNISTPDSGILEFLIGSNDSNSSIHIETITQGLVECNMSGRRQKLYDDSKAAYYDRIIEKLVQMHDLYCNDDPLLGESLSELESECLEMVDLKHKIFGSLKPMPVDEYLNFYSKTGIDIDGRRELLEAIVLPRIDEGIKTHISFAKAIPGFNDLCLDDQIGLIKASRLEFYLIGRHRYFRPQYNLYSPYAGKVIHMEEMRKVKGELVEPVFMIQLKIGRLQLHKDETAVISAIAIMFADNCDLQNRTAVEHIHELLLECLFYVFDKHFVNDTALLRFARIVECLTELRNLREINFKCEEEMANVWWGMIDFPPLVYELWTT